jgi:hypothetical protein
MTRGDRCRTAALGLVIGTQLGCTALAFGGGALAGVGVVAYAKGDVTVIEHVRLSDAWMATQAAMDDLAFTIVSRQQEIGSRSLVACGANEKRVQVRLGTRENGDTEIQVRVGFFGDEDLSWLVLKRIRQRL